MDKPIFHPCTECKYLIECGPLKMAVNSEKWPCEDFKEKGTQK